MDIAIIISMPALYEVLTPML